MLDALVDRQDRYVAGPGQAARVVELAQVAQHRGAAVGLQEHPIEEDRPRQGELVLRDALRLVREQALGLVTEQRLDVHLGLLHVRWPARARHVRYIQRSAAWPCAAGTPDLGRRRRQGLVHQAADPPAVAGPG